MSSTTTTTADAAPSSRVQSASNKDKQETPVGNTSRPPSASQKTAADTSRAPVITATGAGISPGAPAAGRDEPSLLTVTSSERQPSASQQSTTDTPTTLRLGSATKNGSHGLLTSPLSAANVDLTLDSTNTKPRNSRPSSANLQTDEAASHGYSIAITNFRPPSASQKIDESTTNAPTSSRPSSARQKANEPTTTTGSRPPSAKQKTDESTTNGPMSSRPPSASQEANKSTTGSRPPSASQKANESITASIGSRPPSANQKSNESNMNDSNNTSTNSRPPSANQKTDLTTARTGSRPPSASRKQDETTTGDSTTEQQNTAVLFNSNDPNIKQPIIGRPPSTAEKLPTDESNIATTLDTTASPNTLTENVLSSDDNKPIKATHTTPRIGSATKNPPSSTTTENNS